MTEAWVALPRCGDHVYHIPSGKTWVVAWAEGDNLAAAGWPNSIDNVADCILIKRTTDDEHRSAVSEWLSPGKEQDSRHIAIRRLYGHVLSQQVQP